MCICVYVQEKSRALTSDIGIYSRRGGACDYIYMWCDERLWIWVRESSRVLCIWGILEIDRRYICIRRAMRHACVYTRYICLKVKITSDGLPLFECRVHKLCRVCIRFDKLSFFAYRISFYINVFYYFKRCDIPENLLRRAASKIE